jgi:AcrR family transcriptional regulator
MAKRQREPQGPGASGGLSGGSSAGSSDGSYGSSGGPSDPSRQRILDAAEELFARDGFDATPTAAVAKRADVPKGLVFYYFPKKIDVLLALLDERLTTPDPLLERDDVVTQGDVAGTLVALAEQIDLGGQDSPVLDTIIWRETETHPEVRRRLADLYQVLFRLTRRAVIAAESMAAVHPRLDAAVQSFVAAMLLKSNSARVAGPAVDLREVADLVAAGVEPT